MPKEPYIHGKRVEHLFQMGPTDVCAESYMNFERALQICQKSSREIRAEIRVFFQSRVETARQAGSKGNS